VKFELYKKPVYEKRVGVGSHLGTVGEERDIVGEERASKTLRNKKKPGVNHNAGGGLTG